MRYRVYTAPVLIESLAERYPDSPVKEILTHLRDTLSERFGAGVPAPMPYAEGVLLFECMHMVDHVTYVIRAVYEIDHEDCAVDLLDLSISL